MRRVLALLMVGISILALSTLLEHVPAGYGAVTYIPDLSKLYDAFKETTLGNVLVNMLGLESMADNLIVAQLQAYDLDPEVFYSALKEFIFVQKNLNVLGAFGPSQNADKLVDVLKDILSAEATQVEVFIEPVDGYVVISSSKDLVESFKKGGGNVPDEIKKYLEDPDTLGVSFSISKEAKGFGKLHLENRVLVSSGKTIFLDEDLKSKVEKAKPSKPFAKAEEVSGDALLLVNTEDIQEVVSYVKSLGVKLDEDFEEFLKNVGKTALVCVEYTDSAVKSFMGEENPPEPKLKGFFEYEGDVNEIFKNCEKIEGGYKCGNVLAKVEGNTVEFSAPDFDVTLSGKARDYFEKSYAGNEVLFIFADFSRIFEQIFGLFESSYILLRVWIEDGNLVGRFELK